MNEKSEGKKSISNAVRKLAGYQTGTPLCTQGWKKEFSSAVPYFDS